MLDLADYQQGPGDRILVRLNNLYPDLWCTCFEVNFSDTQEGSSDYYYFEKLFLNEECNFCVLHAALIRWHSSVLNSLHRTSCLIDSMPLMNDSILWRSKVKRFGYCLFCIFSGKFL